MIVVAKNKLMKALEMHPIANQPLLGWYKIISESSFNSESELRSTFKNLSCANEQIDFSVPGTDLHIRTLINFDTQVTLIENIRPSR